MKNKRLEALLEEVVKAREEAKEHTPEVENNDVVSKPEVEIKAEGGEPTEKRIESHKVDKEDVHPEEQSAEEIKEIVTEAKKKLPPALMKNTYDDPKDGNKVPEKLEKEVLDEDVYTDEDLMELFEALNLDTDKYTFEYLAEEMGFVPVKGEEEIMPVPEVKDPSEYDEEGDMAKSQLLIIADAAAELHNLLTDDQNLPEWAQGKITLAKDYIDKVRDYMKAEAHSELEDHAVQQQAEVGEMEGEMEAPEEQPLQERYVLKRHVGRPSKKEKALEAKGSSEINQKGEVVYTKKGGK